MAAKVPYCFQGVLPLAQRSEFEAVRYHRMTRGVRSTTISFQIDWGRILARFSCSGVLVVGMVESTGSE